MEKKMTHEEYKASGLTYVEAFEFLNVHRKLLEDAGFSINSFELFEDYDWENEGKDSFSVAISGNKEYGV